jgi:uncharacterized protein YegP (UPF0339 family)
MPTKSKLPRWEIYQDTTNRWRWRKFDERGKIQATSPTGFSSRELCILNARKAGYTGE